MKNHGDRIGGKALVRVSLDMLPKAVQRSGREKQFEVLKKMFKRACSNYGIPKELKEREYYVKPGEKRRKAAKLKKAAARGELRDQTQKDFDRDTKYFDEYNY